LFSFINRFFTIIVFFLIFSCNSSSIDFIIINSNVNTFDSNYSVYSTVAIDDGIFSAIGGKEITKIYQSKNILDAKKMHIYPGLINFKHSIPDIQRFKESLFLNGSNSIEVGKVADFVILDSDIMEIEGKNLSNVKLIAVFNKGRIVYDIFN
tara:strand:+ start:4230 stop:4685 length:456 start_codon:yes stop_codon:yes gene_type:complete